MSVPFDNRDGWIWLNGEFVLWREANTHIINQGLHYGNCVFEGERAYNGKIFKSTEHTDRLFNSAEILGISIPYSKNEINQAKETLINKMNFSNCYVRPVIWRGSQKMGISTNNAEIHAAIAAWEDWESYFPMEKRLKGLQLITSPWKRPSPDSAPYEAKASGLYMICTMSKEFAEKKGFDDCLMLDHRNYVAEGTGANIFFIKNDSVYTPIADCFLNGITRQTVIKIVKNKGFNLEEKYIKQDDLKNFDEAFLTGTAAEVTPIRSIDNVKFSIGDNTKTFKIMNDFSDFVKSSN